MTTVSDVVLGFHRIFVSEIYTTDPTTCTGVSTGTGPVPLLPIFVLIYLLPRRTSSFLDSTRIKIHLDTTVSIRTSILNSMGLNTFPFSNFYDVDTDFKTLYSSKVRATTRPRGFSQNCTPLVFNVVLHVYVFLPYNPMSGKVRFMKPTTHHVHPDPRTLWTVGLSNFRRSTTVIDHYTLSTPSRPTFIDTRNSDLSTDLPRD